MLNPQFWSVTMRHLPWLAAAGLFLGLSSISASAGGQVSNTELRKLVPGNFVAIVHGSVTVTFTAKDNGVLIGQMPGKQDSGRWSLKNGQICIMLSNWTSGKATCSTVIAENGWYRGQGVKFRKL